MVLLASTEAKPLLYVDRASGSVEVSRQNEYSRSFSCTVVDELGALTPGVSANIDPLFRPWIKIYFDVSWINNSGVKETYRIPAGVFAIEKCNSKEFHGGAVHEISGNDLSVIIAQNPWTEPFDVGGTGVMYDDGIRTILINRAVGFTPNFSFEESTKEMPAATFSDSEGNDPWDSAKTLAKADGKELFLDQAGAWTLRTVPDPANIDTVWKYDESQFSMRLGGDTLARDIDTANLYNGVIVRATAPWLLYPMQGVAWDTDEDSPTYYLGTFGKKPKQIENNLVGDQAGLDAAAAAELKNVLGINEQVTFDAVMNPAHEQGDVVMIGSDILALQQKVLLESFTLPFSATESMKGTCRLQRRGITPQKKKDIIIVPPPPPPEQPPVEITTAALPAGHRNAAYSMTMLATNGTTPYHWTATGLPSPLVINQTSGVISGTPTSAGTSNPQITVTDADGDTDVVTLQLYIDTVDIITTSLPAAAQNSAYNYTLYASGGVGPYSWGATGLPTGLSCSPAGVISGTPTVYGSFSPQITVTDAVSNTDVQTFSLSVTPVVQLMHEEMPVSAFWFPGATDPPPANGCDSYSWTFKCLKDPTPYEHAYQMQGSLRTVDNTDGPTYYIEVQTSLQGAPENTGYMNYHHAIIFSVWGFITSLTRGFGPREAQFRTFSGFSGELESGGAGGTIVMYWDWIIGETLTFRMSVPANGSIKAEVKGDNHGDVWYEFGTMYGYGNGYANNADWAKLSKGNFSFLDEIYGANASGKQHCYDFGYSDIEYGNFQMNGSTTTLTPTIWQYGTQDPLAFCLANIIPTPNFVTPTSFRQITGSTAPFPTANVISYNGITGAFIPFQLTGTPAQSGSLTYTAMTLPSNGVLVRVDTGALIQVGVPVSTNLWKYTPNNGSVIYDTFNYKVTESGTNMDSLQQPVRFFLSPTGSNLYPSNSLYPAANLYPG